MYSLFQSLKHFDHQKNYVLAVIVATEGSTYQKTGSLMLIDQSLNYWGLMSGGCIEEDILLHCKEVFKTECSSLINYDMRGENDLLWGMGLGCDGALEIKLTYLPAREKHYGFFSILQKTYQGSNYLIVLDSHIQNNGKKETIEYIQRAKHAENFDYQSNNLSLPSKAKKALNKLFIRLDSPINLLICGGAPDVPPVTAIAFQLGWRTTVIDHRKDYTSRINFPMASDLLHIKRSQWHDFELAKFDACVIMSHQFERDKDYLCRALNSVLPYIGLLGPKKRRDSLLKACGSSYSQQRGRVFGPVGLDIGATTPETIGLSIIAEIQAMITAKLNKNGYLEKTA